VISRSSPVAKAPESEGGDKSPQSCAVKRHTPLEWETPAGWDRIPAEDLK
jgi:hypothetical protein